MKRIFFLLLVCILTNVKAQTPALIAHYLGEAKKMTNTTEDLKPLVLVDDTPYMGSIANFNPKALTSIRIFDPVTAHALFQGAGVHGAVVMTTKYRTAVAVDGDQPQPANKHRLGYKSRLVTKPVIANKPLANNQPRLAFGPSMVSSNPLSGNDQLDLILAKLGPGYKSFIITHKGNTNITYLFNGAPMRGSRSAIALTLSGIPASNIRFVKTKKITNSHGAGAIVYIRTKK